MSVLRDKMMTDMNTEHEALKMKLQQQEEDRLRVEVIGPGGTSYCRASLKNGVPKMPSPNGVPAVWRVKFYPNDDTTTTTTIIPNFIETVAGLNVRVGGVVVFPFNTATFRTYSFSTDAGHAGFDRTRDDTPQMGRVSFTNADSVLVMCRVGPILFDDFVTLLQQLPRRMPVTDLVRFLKDPRNIINGTVLLSEMKITGVMFREYHIKGILPLLEESIPLHATSRLPSRAVTAVDDEDEDTDDSGCGYCYYYCCRRRR